MLWNRLVAFCAAAAALLCGCSSPAPPPDPSRLPASFALADADFPEGYEFHDDRDLRSLDAVELGPQSKDPRLFDYSKLTLDHLAADQPDCAALVGLGSRPTYRSAAGPALPASAESRSSLGFDKRSSTTLAFTVTRDPVPLGRYRAALAGCAQFAVTSEKIGTGQGAITPMDAPVGGLAYGLEAQVQAPSGIGYTFSRALLAAPVGNTTVLGVLSRTSSAEGGKAPLDQATLRALFQKLADRVKKGS